MAKIFRLSVFTLYAFLCFGVATYAFYYLFQSFNPQDTFQVKFSQAGLEIPAHFFGGGLALLLVPFQLSQKLRNYSRKIHKTIGYVYVIAVLFGSISGFVMSFNATGGVVAEWGFRLLSIFWFITTAIAIIYALRGNLITHRKWIYRSIAFTSAAISLRLFLGVGLGVLQLPFLTVYVPTSWLCWVVNVIIAEIIIYQQRPKLQTVFA